MIEIIRGRLASYTANELSKDETMAAAILMPLYDHRGELHVILTRRTDKVEHHKGEISFPGGARDPGDPDLLFTALRESHEEVGIHPGHVEVLGRVDDFITGTRFHVTPYVGLMDPSLSPYAWLPQPDEVAEVLEVPISHLLDPANTMADNRPNRGRMQMDSYVFGEHVIYGATARMLRNFIEIVAAGGFDA